MTQLPAGNPTRGKEKLAKGRDAARFHLLSKNIVLGGGFGGRVVPLHPPFSPATKQLKSRRVRSPIRLLGKSLD